MASLTSITTTTTYPRKKILVVTSDLPSHPYATAKLAKVLAGAGHSVTLAAPKGPAYACIVSETQNINNISCKTLGSVTSTTKHANERPVIDPLSWKSFFSALWNPFPLAQFVVQDLFDRQEDMYEPIKREIESGNYDVIIPIHSIDITVCDAVEASSKDTPIIIFSSLPYDPALYLGEYEGWFMPRSLTAFPHVANYSSTKPTTNIVQLWMQTLWKLLDAWLTSRAWARSAAHNNARRARRGLPAIQDGWRGYFQKYAVICFGGVAPFLDADSKVAHNVTAVGTLDGDHMTPIHGDLKQWLHMNRARNGIVYAGFGTGTVLSDQEAAAITGGIAHFKDTNGNHLPPVLFALRASEQRRLRTVFNDAIGSPPTSVSDTHLEYLHGRVRIQDSVPQATLLSSGQVKVFISHMGMGGFVEGVKGGVPFVAYPSGCDQWFNAQRAVDAGIAVRAPYGLVNIGTIVRNVLENDNLAALARSASEMLNEVHGEERALDLVDTVAMASSMPIVVTPKRHEDTLMTTQSKSKSKVSFRPHVSLVVDRRETTMRRSSAARAA